MKPSPSESLWAEHGLTGMVLFALFTLIGVFVRFMATKDDKHQSFIREMIGEERTERKEARKEHSQTTGKLAEAIDCLASELRDNNRKD